jgi:hypothetical protein
VPSRREVRRAGRPARLIPPRARMRVFLMATVTLTLSPLDAAGIAVVAVAPSLAALILVYIGQSLWRSPARPKPRMRGRAAPAKAKRRG